MEKITLKPAVKELLHRNGEDNIRFDVLSYQGAGNQEKALGSLFVVGQIKYPEEDLSYAISLVSSLAKREYYSEQSLQNQNAKKAFEHTLGKLNEVLDDFFKNKGLRLNIGLLALSGNDIYISRLGKFKVALARDDKYIDILNNIELFSKDTESAKQFSNIISGKLQPQDKIFAYFPTRSVIAREKQLNELFVKEGQEAFSQKIAHLAVNADNFSCCGVHIDMREIKEIPVEAKPGFATPVLASKPTAAPPQSRGDFSRKPPMPSVITANEEKEMSEKPELPDLIPQESPRIIPAEFSMTKRVGVLTPLVSYFSRFKNLGRLGLKARSRGFLLLAVIVMLPLLGLMLYRSIGPSGEIKNAINSVEEKLRLAQTQLNQNNAKEARSLLQAALSNAIGLSNNKIGKIRDEVNQLLNSVNRVSDKKPQLYLDLVASGDVLKPSLIAAYDGLVAAANNDGTIFSINQNSASELAQLKMGAKFLFNTKSAVAAFNGLDVFGVYNLETKKTAAYSLKEPLGIIDAVLYEDNLYALADNTIYKYADAVTGGVKRTSWGSDSASGTLISITADGNIYALNSDGKLIKYFKGKKEGEVDLQLAPTSGSRVFTLKDSSFLYLTDKTNGLVYIFDKATGELKTTYNLALVGSVNDISISPDGTVWIPSADNKVWSLK